MQFASISGPEIGYVYAIPVDGLQGLVDFFAAWEPAIEMIGADKWAEFEARSSKAVEYAQTSMIVLRPDLSFLPETTEISADKPFRKYHWVFIVPGKEEVFEEVARAYVSLWEENGFPVGWRIYQAMMGADLPMYLVVESAKDEAEYVAMTAEMQAALPDAAKELQAKMQQAVRRMEINEGWVRPELSYPAMETGGN